MFKQNKPSKSWAYLTKKIEKIPAKKNSQIVN